MRKLKLFQFLETLFLVLLIVLPIRFFLFEPFFVVGQSMEPTFHSFDYLIVDKISYRFEKPQRNDVIIFRPPVDPSVFYIKRVIGLPGDTVIIQNGHVYIQNKHHPQGYELQEPYLPSTDTTPGNGVFKVTAGHYFVLGDNRAASYDSRRWGLLPAQNIIGKVELNLVPISALFKIVRSGLAR
ncbi:MAG: signal peptidase I [Patescibacteria group bacterium]|nr:signal peptidase I [Patescibacteria group bacterium]MCL5257864.1 signal peptidase I [Patescibacteria group bacterium]